MGGFLMGGLFRHTSIYCLFLKLILFMFQCYCMHVEFTWAILSPCVLRGGVETTQRWPHFRGPD